MLKVMVQRKNFFRAKPLKQLSNFVTNGAGRRSKIFYGVGLSAGVLPSFNSDGHDQPYREDELNEKYVNRDELDWKERLDLMWRRDRYNRLSPELEFCTNVGSTAIFSGLIIGAFKESRHVYMKFVASNKQTMFKHPREAQAILQEQVTYYMLRGGIRWAVKVGIVAFAYVTMCQTAHTIRNSINPVDHMAAGFVSGAVFRTMGGPKAMLGAGIIGSAMGCVDGVSTWCLYKLSGETVSQRWLRELREIHIANSLKDKDQEDQAIIMPNVHRMTEEEWSQKQKMEEEAIKNETPNVFSTFAVNIFQRAKDLLGPRNLDLTHEQSDNTSNVKDSSSDITKHKSSETKSFDDIR